MRLFIHFFGVGSGGSSFGEENPPLDPPVWGLGHENLSPTDGSVGSVEVATGTNQVNDAKYLLPCVHCCGHFRDGTCSLCCNDESHSLKTEAMAKEDGCVVLVAIGSDTMYGFANKD
uniref:Uncharacterized protein n=1 Tax=Quercus lobata TaxID=97700 RepID=A0A7N2MW09_QUELO